MKIDRVETLPLEPRFKGDGYAMSMGRQTVLYHRLLRLTADDGTVGVGEFVRPPTWSVAEIEALEDDCLPALQGIDLADLPALLAIWRDGEKRLQYVVAGIDLAMLDMMGRALGLPVSSLLGGARAADCPEYLSLSCEAPEVMAEIVRAQSQSFDVVQAKLGSDTLDNDLTRVRAVLGAMRPDQRLLADFNGALKPDDAIRALPEINDPRVMWEEPCDEYDDGLAVARGIDASVMLDQCLKDLPTYMRAIQDRAAAALVIKSDSIGGLSVGRTVRDACAAAAIKVRIDGWWAGQVAGAGALHLAVGTPPAMLISSIDLTDPIDTDRSMIARPAPGRVCAGPGPGLGTIPETLFPAEEDGQ
ncbi:mandelate racemase/muconate lactonizing enzyme family protein [Aliiroseovarius sp.]|uniref:mandelate racemase/muconate lactonizing enzyme family protein n=1 Tax=Aliiroseovarius sp. TaxID=1872442 RepID=UPI003BA94635